MSDHTIHGIKAIIFDMDGTLVDSEINTERSVDILLSKRNIPHADLDYGVFYGVTWQKIESILKETYPQLIPESLAAELQHEFHVLFQSDQTEFIPGVHDFWRLAAQLGLRLAIGTSSNRESVEFLVDRMDVRSICEAIVSAEDYNKSKPDPDCYLHAAQKLNLPVENCLVFEDSIPGLKAARAAGMYAVAITHRSTDPIEAARIANLAVANYTRLPDKFLSEIRY
ncbi:MAG: HAD family phosphatase [Leptospiraceae bacterium]|nr:HAD family phosphatase [Leptospiraceae bacterium]